MNKLSKILIIPLLIVMVFAFGMGAFAEIHSKWVAGDLIFYDATTNIFSIRDDTDGVKIYDDLNLTFGTGDDATIEWDAASTEKLIITCESGFTISGAITLDSTFAVTLTNPIIASNAVYGLINAGLPWATDGNLVGVRGKVVVTAAGTTGDATGVWAGIEITSASVQRGGLQVGMNVEAYSNTACLPNAVMYIQSLPSGTDADFTDVPYLVFSETVTNGTGSSILFEVGHSWANTIPTLGDPGDLHYHDTLQIAVNLSAGNRTAYYIPLSTVEGTYTTAYKIVSSYSDGGSSVAGTITNPTAASNVFYGRIVAGAEWSGNLVGVRGKVEIGDIVDITSAAGVWAGIAITGPSIQRHGLVCAINAEVSSTTVNMPNAILYLQSLPSGSAADFSNVPYITFSETISAGTGSNILFEVGSKYSNLMPTIGEDELFYNDTLRIAVNEQAGVRTPFFIPLSTDSGTFTTEYQIISSYGGGASSTNAFTSTITDPTIDGGTETCYGFFSTINAGSTGYSGGYVCGFRGQINIDARSPGDYSNAAAGWFVLDYASTLTADGVGLTAGAYVATQNSCALKAPTAVLYVLDEVEGSGANNNMPILTLASKGTEANKSRVAIAFGFTAAGANVSAGTTGYMYYNETIRVTVNNSVRYIPLSNAEGTYSVGTMANATGSGQTITDSYNKMLQIYCDATADGSTVGVAANELYVGEVRQLLTGGAFSGEQYAWKATQRYYGTPSVGSYSSAVLGKLEIAGTLTCQGYAGCITGYISDVQAGTIDLTLSSSFLFGVKASCNFRQDNSGSGETIAYVTWAHTAYNWDIGLKLLDDSTDTGISIGNATTGINLDGDMATGINMPGTYSTHGISIVTDLTTAKYQINLAGAIAANLTSGAPACQSIVTTIEADSDLSGTAQVFGLYSLLSVEGDDSNQTTLNSGGVVASIAGYYYTDNADIDVTNGIHCAVAATLYAGDDFDVSTNAEYCGLAVIGFTNAGAVIENGLHSGILITKQSGQNFDQAIRVGAGIDNFVTFYDDDVVASVDGNTAAEDEVPDGWIKINVGGTTQYIWTYEKID